MVTCISYVNREGENIHEKYVKKLKCYYKSIFPLPAVLFCAGFDCFGFGCSFDNITE